MVEGKATDVEESFKETVEDTVYIRELAGLKNFYTNNWKCQSIHYHINFGSY